MYSGALIQDLLAAVERAEQATQVPVKIAGLAERLSSSENHESSSSVAEMLSNGSRFADPGSGSGNVAPVRWKRKEETL